MRRTKARGKARLVKIRRGLLIKRACLLKQEGVA